MRGLSIDGMRCHLPGGTLSQNDSVSGRIVVIEDRIQIIIYGRESSAPSKSYCAMEIKAVAAEDVHGGPIQLVASAI